MRVSIIAVVGGFLKKPRQNQISPRFWAPSSRCISSDLLVVFLGLMELLWRNSARRKTGLLIIVNFNMGLFRSPYYSERPFCFNMEKHRRLYLSSR